MSMNKTFCTIDGMNVQLDYHSITFSDGTSGYSGVLFIEPALVFTIENLNKQWNFKPVNTNPLFKEAIMDAIKERENEENQSMC